MCDTTETKRKEIEEIETANNRTQRDRDQRDRETDATEGEQHHHPRWWLPAISERKDRETEEQKAAAA